MILLNLTAPNKTNQCPADKREDKDYCHVTPLSRKHPHVSTAIQTSQRNKGQGTLLTQHEPECMIHLVTEIQQQRYTNLMFNRIQVSLQRFFSDL